MNRNMRKASYLTPQFFFHLFFLRQGFYSRSMDILSSQIYKHVVHCITVYPALPLEVFKAKLDRALGKSVLVLNLAAGNPACGRVV